MTDRSNLMTVAVEVWPLAADGDGIHLVSWIYPWRSDALAAGVDLYAPARQLLRDHGLDDKAVKVLHGTSTRVEDEVFLQTIVATFDCDDLPEHWPDKELVSVALPLIMGPPISHGAAEPPTVRYVDVLLHALRSLRFLRDYSRAESDEMSPAWKAHLQAYKSALAGLYSLEHVPLVLDEPLVPGEV